jgi:hypothetical protein
MNTQEQGRSPQSTVGRPSSVSFKDGRPQCKVAQEGKAAKDTEDPLVKLERAVELLDRGLLSVREYELLKQHILTDLLSTELGWHRTKAGVEGGLSRTTALLRPGKGVDLHRRSGQVECGKSGARHLHQCCMQSHRPWSQRLRWSRRSTAPRLMGVQGVRQPSLQSLWSPFRARPPPSA